MRCWDGARVHRRGQDWPDAEGKADGRGAVAAVVSRGWSWGVCTDSGGRLRQACKLSSLDDLEVKTLSVNQLLV